MKHITLLSLTVLAACQQSPPAKPSDSLDAIARDYVKLSLTIGEKEEGYIDAYYGPPELQAEAKAEAPKLALPELARRTDALSARVAALTPEGDDARRAAFLTAQLTAAKTRLRMMAGEKLSFADEAKGLFGVAPELKPLAAYDPVLAKIETLVPGPGPLSARVDAFQDRFTIPAAKLKPVFDAAIAECKARTVKHIALPKGEKFDMKFVTGKSWSGYNYYLGNCHQPDRDQHRPADPNQPRGRSRLPRRLSRPPCAQCLARAAAGQGQGLDRVQRLSALLAAVADRRRVGQLRHRPRLPRPRAPRLRNPHSLSAGRPADRRRRALCRFAGGDDRARRGALHHRPRICSKGRIDEAEAARLVQRYQLVSPERARQSVAFTKQYRTYVINYGLGQDMVRADIERAGASPDARWKRMEQLLSEPTLPSDLRK